MGEGGGDRSYNCERDEEPVRTHADVCLSIHSPQTRTHALTEARAHTSTLNHPRTHSHTHLSPAHPPTDCYIYPFSSRDIIPPFLLTANVPAIRPNMLLLIAVHTRREGMLSLGSCERISFMRVFMCCVAFAHAHLWMWGRPANVRARACVSVHSSRSLCVLVLCSLYCFAAGVKRTAPMRAWGEPESKRERMAAADEPYDPETAVCSD